jgi:hypothetical protein
MELAERSGETLAAPAQCRASASAGPVPVPGQCQCRASASAGPVPGQCQCRARAGPVPVPGQCQCRASTSAGPVSVPGQRRAVPGRSVVWMTSVSLFSADRAFGLTCGYPEYWNRRGNPIVPTRLAPTPTPRASLSLSLFSGPYSNCRRAVIPSTYDVLISTH